MRCFCLTVNKDKTDKIILLSDDLPLGMVRLLNGELSLGDEISGHKRIEDYHGGPLAEFCALRCRVHRFDPSQGTRSYKLQLRPNTAN